MFLLATPFKSRGWLTFKQVASIGGKVLKGSRATDIFFFTTIEVEKEDRATGEKVKVDVPCLKNFKVFNLEQCELPEDAPIKYHPENMDKTQIDDNPVFDDCEKLLNLAVWY